MPYPESMLRLIDELAKLPGVGRRTAERFAFYVLSAPKESVQVLVKLLAKVNESIHSCQQCFNLSEESVCRICADPGRDHAVVCVVQDPKDVVAIEKSGDYAGVYHVLLGVLSPLEGIGPKDLKVKELLQRVRSGGVTEVILATSSDTEGDATAIYLTKQLKVFPASAKADPSSGGKGGSASGGKLKVTRIAHGVPVGSALEFADKATLSRALRQRQQV